jgi:folate-binding Fe-S cluster repair protein YgfZ
MNPSDWHAQLTRVGLEPADASPALPGPLPESGFCDLGGEALLLVDGPEAVTFLQGQLTCDVHELAEGSVLPAAHLTPKGRAIATFLAWQIDSEIHLQFPGGALEEAVTRRLRMFLMRSKATVSPAGDDLVRLGTWGQAAAEVVADLAGALPGSPMRSLAGGDRITLLTLPGAEPRMELALPIDTAINLTTRLQQAGAVACAPAAWRLLDIRAGLGWVRDETSETFLPQMLNYDGYATRPARPSCPRCSTTTATGASASPRDATSVRRWSRGCITSASGALQGLCAPTPRHPPVQPGEPQPPGCGNRGRRDRSG